MNRAVQRTRPLVSATDAPIVLLDVDSAPADTGAPGLLLSSAQPF